MTWPLPNGELFWVVFEAPPPPPPPKTNGAGLEDLLASLLAPNANGVGALDVAGVADDVVPKLNVVGAAELGVDVLPNGLEDGAGD